jgi:hypothetical protein
MKRLLLLMALAETLLIAMACASMKTQCEPAKRTGQTYVECLKLERYWNRGLSRTEEGCGQEDRRSVVSIATMTVVARPSSPSSL